MQKTTLLLCLDQEDNINKQNNDQNIETGKAHPLPYFVSVKVTVIDEFNMMFSDEIL